MLWWSGASQLSAQRYSVLRQERRAALSTLQVQDIPAAGGVANFSKAFPQAKGHEFQSLIFEMVWCSVVLSCEDTVCSPVCLEHLLATSSVYTPVILQNSLELWAWNMEPLRGWGTWFVLDIKPCCPSIYCVFIPQTCCFLKVIWSNQLSYDTWWSETSSSVAQTFLCGA